MVDDEIRAKVNRYLINHTEFLKVKDNLNEDQLRKFVSDAIDEMCLKDDIGYYFIIYVYYCFL